jgi:hypothetical protein
VCVCVCVRQLARECVCANVCEGECGSARLLLLLSVVLLGLASSNQYKKKKVRSRCMVQGCGVRVW